MQRREDAKKEVPLLVAQGKEFPINSLLPFTSQGRRRGWGMRWGTTRSLCFANRMEFEKYPPDLAHVCIAASSFTRRPVLFPPSSPPPLAPARGRRGAKRRPVAGRGGRVVHAKTRRRKEDEILLCRAGDDVGEHAQFEVSRSLQFGVRVVVTRGVVGFAVVV